MYHPPALNKLIYYFLRKYIFFKKIRSSKCHNAMNFEIVKCSGFGQQKKLIVVSYYMKKLLFIAFIFPLMIACKFEYLIYKLLSISPNQINY